MTHLINIVIDGAARFARQPSTFVPILWLISCALLLYVHEKISTKWRHKK